MKEQAIARRGVVALLAGSAIALATQPLLAEDAISSDAREAVSRMSKTLATGAFSFQSMTIRQFEKDNLPLHISHTAEVLVRRPDRLMIIINGDDGQAQIGYDGSTLTIYSAKSNKYGTLSSTGSVETMLRAASERLGMDFPLADLLADQPGRAFLDGILTGTKVGDATIGGQTCNHFFFLQPPGIELELWTEDNEQSLPRRLAITYRSIPGEPQFLAEMSNWRLGLNPPDDAFVIKLPAGAMKTEGREKAP